jgi:uncharacterized protein (TIGR03083 family)
MTDQVSRIVSRLEREGERSLAFFRDLQPEDWDQQVYSEGVGWTVRHVLAHFVESETSIARLVAHIVEGGPGVPEEFDLDSYNEREVARMVERTPKELMEAFSAARAKTIAMVRAFPPAHLEKTGRHPFLGIAPVVDILKLMYRHTMIHQRDLRRTLK